ncbi:hypothetical protein AYI69_g1456 [Smittium culicis]|uniref:Uncharacterized protein n=1 Tax=Smittium culicis TaxID=133412 RepID=A0A1R1YQA8_9FUNG|nr:hypothetical protein AYI69_g1456 [Smittium culicis]
MCLIFVYTRAPPVSDVPLSDNIFSGHPCTNTIFSCNIFDLVSGVKSLTAITSTHQVNKYLNTNTYFAAETDDEEEDI